eukprot:UN20327
MQKKTHSPACLPLAFPAMTNLGGKTKQETTKRFYKAFKKKGRKGNQPVLQRVSFLPGGFI